MRIALIGITGHIEYVFKTAQMRQDVHIVSAAPGNKEENFSSFVQRLCEKRSVIRIYDDWREMLDREKPDVVSVAPWFCHCAEIAVECLSRGIHVYSEKPLATELCMLDKLQAAWEKSNCALDGMFGLRYTPWFQAVHQAIEDGEIGIVRQIHAQKSYKLGRRGELYKKQSLYGGILPWVGIHAMDWAMQLGGDCQRVHAFHSRQYNREHGELEVSSAALLELQNGVIATVTADFLRPTGALRHDDDRLRVTGTDGMIEVVDGSVFLENEQRRRKLVLPQESAPMNDFIDSIGTERSRLLTMQALGVTRAALMARDDADGNRINGSV